LLSLERLRFLFNSEKKNFKILTRDFP